MRKSEPEITRMVNVRQIDYFEPINVSVGNTRAIHLELATTLSTGSAIMAIRRMIARRGSPSELYVDNGINFTGANNKLKRAIKEVDLDTSNTEMMSRGIK